MNLHKSLRIGAVCALVVLVAACEDKNKSRFPFDGFFFKTKSAKVDDDRAIFVATVSGVSASLEGARQAVEHEGTKYCIINFGTSDIEWSVGPDTPPAQLSIVDDTLSYQGKCDP